MTNTLYYGDNLEILREYVPDKSVDLVYLDPPFNSNATYNVLFKERTGEESPAQIKAFTDTWEWTRESERTFEQEILGNPSASPMVKEMIGAFLNFIGRNAMMAYLVMMAPRLVELRRVLKPTGSIYLHCDPTASHYLKLLLDSVFDPRNFRNEIIWRRTGSHNSAKRFGPIHDVLLFYAKSDEYQHRTVFAPYLKGHVDSYFKREDENGHYWTNSIHGSGTRNGESGQPWRGFDPTLVGRHWAIPSDLVLAFGINTDLSQHEKLDALYELGMIDLPEGSSNTLPTYRQYLHRSLGQPLQDLWAFQPHTKGCLYGTDDGIDEDTRWIPPRDKKERLGYPTQKPVGLLERIIQSSSNQGDVILDPFCGCGTAVAAAQKLNRRWIGIDITHLAVALMKNRLKTGFDLAAGKDYKVVGEPVDVGSAKALAEQDRFQFQYWAMSLLEALPRGDEKKGADRGIDGVVHFVDGPKRKMEKAIVQVKSGKVSSPHIRDLKGTMEREKAALGLFITLEEPTREMEKEAVSAGFYHSELWQRDYPKLQIRTVGELMEGKAFEMPSPSATYKPAPRVKAKKGRQGKLN